MQAEVDFLPMQSSGLSLIVGQYDTLKADARLDPTIARGVNQDAGELWVMLFKVVHIIEEYLRSDKKTALSAILVL